MYWLSAAGRVVACLRVVIGWFVVTAYMPLSGALGWFAGALHILSQQGVRRPLTVAMCMVWHVKCGAWFMLSWCWVCTTQYDTMHGTPMALYKGFPDSLSQATAVSRWLVIPVCVAEWTRGHRTMDIKFVVRSTENTTNRE